MRKPNWKRQGLSRPVTEKELRLRREKRDLDRLLDRTIVPRIIEQSGCVIRCEIRSARIGNRSVTPITMGLPMYHA